MSIALTEEHQELVHVARAFLDSNKAREESRATPIRGLIERDPGGI